MSRLDAEASYSIDRSGMLRHILEFGTQLESGWRRWQGLELPAGASPGPRSIVVAGMGGSGSGGDYLQAVCRDIAPRPVHVVRGYRLPEHVGSDALVVILSHSGETGEMLSCYEDARRRGAALVVGTGGGELGRRAAADGVPLFRIDYDSPPRAALPHFLAFLLRVAEREDTAGVGDNAVARAAEAHRRLVEQSLGPEWPSMSNPAKQLAEATASRRPIIVAAEHLTAVATRFKNQLAENAKQLATSESLPEAAHNLVVGLCIEGASEDHPLDLVTLESDLYDPRMQQLFESTVRLCQESGCRVHRVRLEGGDLLSDLTAGTAWADLTSYYAAILRGIDPTPIREIEQLKNGMLG
jgi:glucose/mannose-6-phosphate isomerase